MPAPDLSLDVLRSRRGPLDAIFAPSSVAVIGATDDPDSVGRTLLWNLVSNPFGGTVYPVNPRRSSVLGIRCYPDVASLPERIDLAVIATPALTVPGVVRQCVAAGIPGAIIITAGFKEVGFAGAKLENEVLEEARKGGMRIIGPNCLGVMNPVTGLNATFAGAMARPGNVGFLSQSGALCTSVLDWSFRENVGFSAFVSVGSMADVGWGDLIDYLGGDPRTKSIVIYMESVGEARSFISAAREVALTKPIIVIKAGRTEAAAKAASSHTGALTGSDEVLDAAFRRCGVLRVNSIADLFHMAEVLSSQPRPKGPNLTIVTNAGGPAVLAADALVANGGQVAELAPETVEALDEFLPRAWSHGNPIDILGDADPERFEHALRVAAEDPNSDGLLAILTPQAMTDPTQTAERLKAVAVGRKKPILASWMGGPDIAAGESILQHSGVPNFLFPDTAARVFASMWQNSSNLELLYETPDLPAEPGVIDHESAERLLEGIRDSGRTLLTEFESKQLLSFYRIPTVQTRLAQDEAAAIEAAGAIGYPVAVKLNSTTVTHKADVGGVELNLRSADEVRAAFERIRESVSRKSGPAAFEGVTVQEMARLDGYELIMGSSIDSQFGPVLLFGAGGTLVEVLEDRALALPPLTTTLARRAMEQTRIHRALHGVRGRPPVDLRALEHLFVRFSQLIVEQPWISELDINPLLASHERLLALDARVVLFPPGTPAEQLSRPVIRPYPAQYVGEWQTRDGQRIRIRPIRPEDEPLLVGFHESLSIGTVYSRYFQAMKLTQRIAHQRLTRICFIDYSREMALVAEPVDPPGSGRSRIMGVGRLTRIPGDGTAEFALLIADEYQHLGLGSELLRRLLEIGRKEGIREVRADILAENLLMQRIARREGFELQYNTDGPVLTAKLMLEPAAADGPANA